MTRASENGESAIVVEVSEPDARNSNQGFVAFTTNRAETQVALKEGEPLVIAGLLRQKVDKSGDGLPALGRIPALGYLFGSREARTEQTELFLQRSPHIQQAARMRELRPVGRDLIQLGDVEPLEREILTERCRTPIRQHARDLP
jgi:Flp pilus assembly secretin CpaC